MLKVLKIVLTAALLMTSSGLAAPVDDALVALLRGQPDVTVNLLRGSKDAPSLALLARAYMGQTTFLTDMPGKKKLYTASEAAARAAIAADPRNAEGYVELANALALQLQGAGVVQATRSGLEIKRLFEQAVKLDPALARAWMGLGVWHAQALGLGPLVRLTTGASEQTMRTDHQKAIDLEPNEVFFRLNYADSLILLAKADAGRAAALTAEARGLLSAALTLTPQTYWQRYDLNQVRQRLSGLK